MPGLGLAITGLLVLLVGVTATNMVGKRVLQRAEAGLLHIPLFKTVYAPVKQLVAAFSPDNEYGFKRVVLVQEPGRGYVLGFLTREFTLQRVDGVDTLLAVYIPTNHLYLGDIVVYPRERVLFPELTVEDGVRIFLTGGMALPLHVAAQHSTAGPSAGPTHAGTPRRRARAWRRRAGWTRSSSAARPPTRTGAAADRSPVDSHIIRGFGLVPICHAWGTAAYPVFIPSRRPSACHRRSCST